MLTSARFLGPTYDGVTRIIEPYWLRQAGTGNTLLYAFELLRNGQTSGSNKAFKVSEVHAATITNQPFKPRYRVEL